MTSMAKYMMDLDAVSNGVKVYLKGGKDGDWILTRSMHSKVFDEAMEKALDEIRENPSSNRKELELRCVCKLVSGWSFEEECTEENVYEFLSAAPQIVKMLNRAAGEDSRFFQSSGKNSLNGQKRKSASSKKSGKQAGVSAST